MSCTCLFCGIDICFIDAFIFGDEVPELTTLSLEMLSSSAVFGVAVAIVAVPWITDSSLSICPLAISAAVLLP